MNDNTTDNNPGFTSFADEIWQAQLHFAADYDPTPQVIELVNTVLDGFETEPETWNQMDYRRLPNFYTTPMGTNGQPVTTYCFMGGVVRQGALLYNTLENYSAIQAMQLLAMSHPAHDDRHEYISLWLASGVEWADFLRTDSGYNDRPTQEQVMELRERVSYALNYDFTVPTDQQNTHEPTIVT